MKKKQMDVIENGLSEYETEKFMADAEKAAEINQAWNEYEKFHSNETSREDVKFEEQIAWNLYEDSLFVKDEAQCAEMISAYKMEVQRFQKEDADSEENWLSYEEEVRRTDRLAAARDPGKNRRRAAAKAKRRCVEVAEIACRAIGKSTEHDNHWSYKMLSLTKSIHGNHDIFKSRTCKAECLIKRAEKVTGGQFDWRKVF